MNVTKGKSALELAHMVEPKGPGRYLVAAEAYLEWETACEKA